MTEPGEPDPEASRATEPQAEPAPLPPLPLSLTAATVALVAGLSAEGIGFLLALAGCGGYQLMDFLLIVATVGLVGGGVLALILVARPRPLRAGLGTGRGRAIAALIAGVVSIPINVILIGLSGFCVMG